jgi:hypothetical protein
MDKVEIDLDRVDDAVLALFYLTAHGDRIPGLTRAWKTFSWEAMNRLHAKGLIGDPVSKAKSVVLMPDGLSRGEALVYELFRKRGTAA